jgi:uncharacterized protein DUF3224
VCTLVQNSEAKPYDQTKSPTLLEIHLSETFTGDINAVSQVRALQVQCGDRSASMVSMQRVEGKLGGRQGTFVLQGAEIVAEGKITATWFVVPGSEQATSLGYAARAALRAILAKDPLGRWSTGSNDVPIIDDRSAAPGERECRPPDSCAFYRRLSVGILSLRYPVLSRPTRQHSPHSHSTIPRNSNALILRRKFLPPATKSLLLDPSEIPALDFAGEFPQFKNWSVSATIGINWSICDRSRNDRKSLERRRSSAEPDSSKQHHHCKRSARGCASARSIATQLPAAIPAMLRPR